MAEETLKAQAYQQLIRAVEAALSGEPDPLIWMAGLSCLIRDTLDFVWVGFYRVQGDELLIGPYQGTFGCTRIPFGKGICGTCAVHRKTIIVPDVHQFPGHIACDSKSKSEIVVPVFDETGQLRAVIDIDSVEYSTFDRTDQDYLERIAKMMRGLEWSRIG
ncbi:MAG TPA: GAF domain-containing protein [Acidobacteriota bacterium]|jgi:L-methionine (R)-S-oxide reductase|nr:GAF domain-containing protein [Acidobacteriota bacterium]